MGMWRSTTHIMSMYEIHRPDSFGILFSGAHKCLGHVENEKIAFGLIELWKNFVIQESLSFL